MQVLHFTYADSDQIYRKFLTFRHCKQQPPEVQLLMSPPCSDLAQTPPPAQSMAKPKPKPHRGGIIRGEVLPEEKVVELAGKFALLVPPGKCTLSNVSELN